MRKKILLTLLIVSILTCLFAIGISAVRVEDYDDTFELQNTTSIVHYEKWFYNENKNYVRKGYTDSITVTFVDENDNTLTEVAMWEYDETEGRYYSLVWYISDYELTWEDQIYTDDNVGDQTYPKYTSAIYTLSKIRAVDLRYYTYNSNRSNSNIPSWTEARTLKCLEGIYLTNGTPDDTTDDIKLQDAVGIGRDNDNYGYVGYDSQFAATGNKIVVGNFRDCNFECDMEGNYGTANTWSRADNLQCLWYPDTMKYIGGGISSVYEIDLGDGMEIIACQILRENKRVKEIVLPNSLLCLSSEAFRGSDLTKLTVGENLIVSVSNNAFLYTGGADTLVLSKNLLTTLTSKISELLANKNITIYFDGNLEEATALMERIISENSGTYSGKINLLDYKTTQERPSNSNVYIFYNYNRCEAFYRGEHGESATTYSFIGEDYTTDFYSHIGCQRCNDTVDEKICGPLFVNRGYSKVEDGSSFTYGITINDQNIAKYVEITGESFKYGFVVGSVPTSAHDQIIDSEGNSLLEKTVAVDFTKIDYKNLTIYNVKIVGIDTDEQKGTPIYCCAYVIDGSNISYMGDAVTDKAVSVSSNSITVVEATTPKETEE